MRVLTTREVEVMRRFSRDNAVQVEVQRRVELARRWMIEAPVTKEERRAAD